MPSVRVVVHLGPMKTGTSAFAAHLSSGADVSALPKHILYPTGDLWFPRAGSITKHHDLVELAPATPPNGSDRFRETSATPELIRGKLRDIVAAARERKCDVTVVMVCELADQRATPELGAVLKEFFERVDFVIVSREQSSALRSLMGQQIRMWRRRGVLSTNPRKYIAKHVARGSYDYAKLCEKWQPKSGSYGLHFVPYRDGVGTDDLSHDIFTAVGLGEFPHSERILAGERIHGNFSAAGMKRLAGIKHFFHIIRVIPGSDAVGKYLFDRVFLRLHAEVQRGQVLPHSTWRFSPHNEALCRDSYRDSNMQFRTSLGPVASEVRWARWFAKALGETS